MKTLKLPECDLEVSAICCGAMQLCYLDDAASRKAFLDAYVEAGGRFFDTAHCYCFWVEGMNGQSEVMLGRYLRDNLRRDEYVVATKGAHPGMEDYRDLDLKYMASEVIESDLDDSLDRLGVEQIDLYWLHRDDPRVPVGEIVEMLNVEIRKGRIRACGASNWTAGRIGEANKYARENGLQGFSASQPSWSLGCKGGMPEGDARLEPGTLLALDSDDYKWHAESQVPVIAYNSTARGFFAREGREPENYVNELSLERYERVRELAAVKGASLNQIAVAWLMYHPFPCIPILGTKDADHMRDGLGALQVSLSLEEVEYLSCGVLP